MLDHRNNPSTRGRRRLPLLLLSLAALCAWPAAVPAANLVTGVSAGVGIALDAIQNDLYYVEFNGGTLRRVDLDPTCEAALPPTCPVTTVASGFAHPEDIAIDAAGGVGYVTTRDDTGTTGAFWRVDLATGTKTLVTFNLGAPHQIVLDLPANSAYVVGFDSGIVWRIDLTTGVKVAEVTGLGSPVGLAITADRASAYVTEQVGNRLAEYDLATGNEIREVASGFTAPFYLQWTDPAETALYLVERNAANQVTWVDALTGSTAPVLTGLPLNPSGIVVNQLSGTAYVAADALVLVESLASLPLGEPVFLGVGHVPSTKIDAAGYATTDPTYFFKVVDAPFGGSLNIFGNLSNFASLGATHYRVERTHLGVTTEMNNTWNAYKWDPVESEYKIQAVGPIPSTTLYEIPAEYPALPQRWYPAFLMMRWPSSPNGLHTFRVRLYTDATGTTEVTHLLPAAKNSMTLLVDNSAPDVDLISVIHNDATLGPVVVQPCDIVSDPDNSYQFNFRAFDSNHHMLSYRLRALWGKNQSATIFSASYSPPTPEGPHFWSGEANATLPAVPWSASCNCAHTFILHGWKRTINGYHYILRRESHQSVTLNNTGISCP